MAQCGPNGLGWPKWPRVALDCPGWPRMAQMAQMAQGGPNGPKWPQWLKVSQNGPNGLGWSKWPALDISAGKFWDALQIGGLIGDAPYIHPGFQELAASPAMLLQPAWVSSLVQLGFQEMVQHHRQGAARTSCMV